MLELDGDCANLPEKFRHQLRKATYIGLIKLLGIQITTWTIAHGVVWYYSGWMGVLYMMLSASFANGAFCHPYLGFWIIQHQCCSTDDKQYQPTVSYTGNGLDPMRLTPAIFDVSVPQRRL